ncbi:hypothetical protein MYSTI_07541 [Myxococcus stipitatus DSM 14675]|uniref:Uncharacterized protein n=1 Tax=Myxococcus stipitatus (strain DSM 14675 / JCM 12634 / Mx s8) TaxID=1278073 RepID=L7ULC4_MYXSD|nr:hypothetical protein [Myxococcus stipitatus]AGC48813.1 hypothetical protein MYSTI_07541 [Myxococcus stipitatus DSM 14675]
MNLLEPIIFTGAALTGVAGAILGIRADPVWGVEGFVGGALRGVGGFVGGVVLGAVALYALVFALGALLALKARAGRRPPR